MHAAQPEAAARKEESALQQQQRHAAAVQQPAKLAPLQPGKYAFGGYSSNAASQVRLTLNSLTTRHAPRCDMCEGRCLRV